MRMGELFKAEYIFRAHYPHDRREWLVSISPNGIHALEDYEKEAPRSRRKVSADAPINAGRKVSSENRINGSYIYIHKDIQTNNRLLSALSMDCIELVRDFSSEEVGGGVYYFEQRYPTSTGRNKPVNYDQAMWLWRAIGLKKVVIKNDFGEREICHQKTGTVQLISREACVSWPKEYELAVARVRKLRGLCSTFFSPAEAWSSNREARFKESRALWLRIGCGCDERRNGEPLRDNIRFAKLIPVLHRLKRHRLIVGAVIDSGYAFELIFFLRRRVLDSKRIDVALKSLADKFKDDGADPEAAQPISWLAVPGSQRLMPRRTTNLRTTPPHGECRLLYLNVAQECANALVDVEHVLGCARHNRNHPGRDLPPPM